MLDGGMTSSPFIVSSGGGTHISQIHPKKRIYIQQLKLYRRNVPPCYRSFSILLSIGVSQGIDNMPVVDHVTFVSPKLKVQWLLELKKIWIGKFSPELENHLLIP